MRSVSRIETAKAQRQVFERGGNKADGPCDFLGVRPTQLCSAHTLKLDSLSRRSYQAIRYCLLVAVLTCTSASFSNAQTQNVDNDRLRESWKAFLLSDEVFGDFSEAQFDVSMAETARSFIPTDDRVLEADVQQVRMYCRALWVGVNLEYQACLSSSSSKLRQTHAQRSLIDLRRLRTAFSKRPIMSWEEDTDSKIAWQQALLTLSAIENELSGIAPSEQLAAEIVARRSIIQEFNPANDLPSSPNGKLLLQVSQAFAKCRRVAKLAISASVQGSLTLGGAYGHSPKRDAGAAKGVTPPDIKDWKSIEELINQTDTGASLKGILQLYEELAKRKVQTNWEWKNSQSSQDTLFAASAPSELQIDGVDKQLSITKLRSNIGVAKLALAAQEALDGIQKLAATNALPNVAVETSKNGARSIFLPELVQQDGKIALPDPLEQFRIWLDAELLGQSRAAKEWKQFKLELQSDRNNLPGDVKPVTDQTYNDLIAVAWNLVTDKWTGLAKSGKGPWRQLQIADGSTTSTAFATADLTQDMQNQAKTKATQLVDDSLKDWIVMRIREKWKNIPSEVGGESETVP